LSWDKQLAYPIFFVIDEHGRRWALPRIKAMGFAPHKGDGAQRPLRDRDF
jgi:hypothetical protein